MLKTYTVPWGKNTVSKMMLGSPGEFMPYFHCGCDCGELPNHKIGARKADGPKR